MFLTTLKMNKCQWVYLRKKNEIEKKSLNDKSLVNGHCDFTKKIANKSALQFHKFSHVASEKVNEKHQN